MADLIKKIKIKKQDGTFTDYIPIGADAQNVADADGESVQLKLNKKPYYYNNVADMKADAKLKAGDMAITLGYYEANDGGGAEYKIVNNSDKYYEELNNNLLAELIIKDIIYPEQFGAKGDGVTDDTAIIQYMLDNYNIINFYNKTYIAKGLYIQTSNKKLIGDKTKIKGNKTTEGLCIYSKTSASTSVQNINISDITFTNYTIALSAINVVRFTGKDIICDQSTVGARFAGGCWVNKFYNCSFRNSTSDGFQCGMDITHPILNTAVVPNIATFDFYTCGSVNNHGYGFNGWMRNFNFFGGYSENNTLGAVRMEDNSSRPNLSNGFFGFDIEEENIGYFCESINSDYCRVSHLTIQGGQVAFNSQQAGIPRILLKIKGTRCSRDYVHNIFINTRYSLYENTTTDIQDYFCYVEHTYSGTPNLSANFNTGNQNTAWYQTNANIISPNMFKIKTSTIPLQSLEQPQYYDGTNYVLPAGASFGMTLSSIKRLGTITINTTGSASYRLFVFGKTLNNLYGQILSTSATSDNNIATLNPGSGGDRIVIQNTSDHDITITNIAFNNFYMTMF